MFLTMLSRVALLCVGLALTSALEEMVMKPRREVDVKHRAHQRFVKLRAEHKKAQEEEAEGAEVGAMSALEEDEPKAQAKSSAPYVPPMMPMLNPMPMMMARAKAVALAAAPTNGASISLLEANKPLQAAEAGKKPLDCNQKELWALTTYCGRAGNMGALRALGWHVKYLDYNREAVLPSFTPSHPDHDPQLALDEADGIDQFVTRHL